MANIVNITTSAEAQNELFRILSENKSNYVVSEDIIQKRANSIKSILNSGLVEEPFLELMIETAIEQDAHLPIIKVLVEHNPKILQENRNLFKWACAFSGMNTIKYLEKKVKHLEEYSAITAAITHWRIDSLEHLVKNGYPVFKETHFCKALAGSVRFKDLRIFERIFLENIDKVDDFSSFSIREVKNSWVMTTHNEDIKAQGEDILKKVETILFKNSLDNNLPKKKTNNSKKKKI